MILVCNVLLIFHPLFSVSLCDVPYSHESSFLSGIIVQKLVFLLYRPDFANVSNGCLNKFFFSVLRNIFRCTCVCVEVTQWLFRCQSILTLLNYRIHCIALWKNENIAFDANNRHLSTNVASTPGTDWTKPVFGNKRLTSTSCIFCWKNKQPETHILFYR